MKRRFVIYPNPATVLPLTPRPNLEQYKKLAKDLVRACMSDRQDALRAWAAKWIAASVRLQGMTISSQLREWIELQLNRSNCFWTGVLLSKR